MVIRTKETVVSPELKKVWKKVITPAANEALADFRTWPLYQHVGEPWADADKKFVRVTAMSAISKGQNSSTTQKLEKEAHAGLKGMYMNTSMLLNARQQHFSYGEWDRVAVIIWRATEKALAELTKRTKWKPKANETGSWLYGPNTYLWQHVWWEQLHPKTIEAPFYKHYVAILRAGHFPAGLQGKDWKTCQFLYC